MIRQEERIRQREERRRRQEERRGDAVHLLPRQDLHGHIITQKQLGFTLSAVHPMV